MGFKVVLKEFTANAKARTVFTKPRRLKHMQIAATLVINLVKTFVSTSLLVLLNNYDVNPNVSSM